jgi:hypothetical protein
MSLRRGALGTLQRVYQIVAAHLYRAEMRSPVAEDAWAAATAEDIEHADLPEKMDAAHVRAARNRAVDAIAAGGHPPSITESAIDTLDHAIYAATAEARAENDSSPPSSGGGDVQQHEHRR